MNLKSIRWKLSLTYAGLALVTAVAMGAMLLLTLRGYYSDQERAYLEKNARSVSVAVAPLLESENPPIELGPHIKLLSFLSQTRVRVQDAGGAVLIDSGAPTQDNPILVSVMLSDNQENPTVSQVVSEKITIPAGETANEETMKKDSIFVFGTDEDSMAFSFGSKIQSQPVEGEVTATRPDEKLQFFYREMTRVIDDQTSVTTAIQSGSLDEAELILIAAIPASGTMYGFDLASNQGIVAERSNIFVSQSILDDDGRKLGVVTLSDGPAIGNEIVAGVARGGMLAALAAVAIAAVAGWWVSRRMSAPLTELTGSARQMSTGDLSVRAGVTSEDEFGNLATAFNDMADRVQAIVDSLRSFASDAAHELQTPLTALNTNLELAAQQNPESLYLIQAREQFKRLETLAANLLDLSRIENGDSVEASGAPLETIDIRTLLQSIGERYASEAEQARKMFYLEVPDQQILVAGHPDRLRRAITNLLDNALKFTPPGGMIEAGIVQEDERVKIWVEDNGIGIPAEDQPRLFQRFHRGHNVSDFPGSGLGLAIVQAIVEKHGGWVRYEALTRGSKFWIELPAK